LRNGDDDAWKNDGGYVSYWTYDVWMNGDGVWTSDDVWMNDDDV
jgi:hypothetical protein